MVWLEGLGKTIGQVALGVTDAAQTVTDAAQETMEQIKRQREQEQNDVKKCPSCGQPLTNLQVACPLCEYELRPSDFDEPVSVFVKELSKLERSRNSVVGSLSKAIPRNGPVPIDEKIASTIRDYVVPNSKEDILEFMLLAESRMDAKTIAKMTRVKSVVESEVTYWYKAQDEADLIQSAWASKFDQTYQRAMIAFGDDSDFRRVRNLYDSKMREIEFEKEKAKSIFARMW